MVEILDFLRHFIEFLVLFTIVVELILLTKKLITGEKGARSLLLLLLVSTIFARDIMLTLEVHSESPVDPTILLIEVGTIFLTFIIISIKEKYLSEGKKIEN